MKSFSVLILLFVITYYSAFAQQNCMTEENIKALDAQWEENNIQPDPEFLKIVLAENFVWVHNHASMVDTKSTVLKKAESMVEKGTTDTRSRIQSEVKVAITGNTAIITGFTVKDSGPKPTTYHFMRTYVEVDGNCLLIGNHTMAIPKEE